MIQISGTVCTLLILAFVAIINMDSSSTMVEAKIRNQCVSRGMFAMNWDDGPSQNTMQLLGILRDNDVKATFHVTTKYITDPNIQGAIQSIAREGHLLGLRAEPSWNLFSMTDEQIAAGIVRQANVLGSFIGYVPKFIRLAYNGYDDRVLRAVESTGMIATSHNLETYDYGNDSQKIFNAVNLPLSLQARGGGSFIAIQHDAVSQSVGAAAKIIKLVKGSGYKFVKMDECLGLGDMTQNKEALKGGNDDVTMGDLSQDQQSFLAGPSFEGGMMGGDGSGMAGGNFDSGAFGSVNNFSNSAMRSSSSSMAALAAVAVAALVLFA